MTYNIKILKGYSWHCHCSGFIGIIYKFSEDDDYYNITGSSNFTDTYFDCKISKNSYNSFYTKYNDALGSIHLEYKKIHTFSQVSKLRNDFPLLEFYIAPVDKNLFNGLSEIYILADGMKSFFKLCKYEDKKLIELSNINLAELLPPHNFRNQFELPFNVICFNNKKFIYTRFNKSRGIRQQLIFISDDNSWNFNRNNIVNLESKSGMTNDTIYCCKIILKNNKLYGVFYGYDFEINNSDYWKTRNKEIMILTESTDGINFKEIDLINQENMASYSMTILGGNLDTILITNSSKTSNGINEMKIITFN
jgi:hypothetical protein